MCCLIKEKIMSDNNNKTWEYNVSTNVIWLDFDYGTVQASNYDEALNLAKNEISNNLTKANKRLKGLAEIGINLDEVIVTEKT